METEKIKLKIKITNLTTNEIKIVFGMIKAAEYINCSISTIGRFKNKIYKNFKIEILNKGEN